ncbi:MAG TPA: hypothetical protein VGR57_21760 [Ktedonobacterales bacterium]|nr:hypothetical protein [Ktedonobacterales bacterium]
MKIALRMLAMIVGLIGSVLALVFDFITSVIKDLTGHHNQSHGILGLVLTIVAFIGALLAVPSGMIGAVLLVIAGVGLFFVLGVGPAIIPAIFLLGAAVLAYMDRSRAAAS